MKNKTKVFIGLLGVIALFFAISSCTKKDSTPGSSRWLYSTTVPAGFDDPNGSNPITGGEEFYVIFKKDQQTCNGVWTKHGQPGIDPGGKMYYGYGNP